MIASRNGLGQTLLCQKGVSDWYLRRTPAAVDWFPEGLVMGSVSMKLSQGEMHVPMRA